ncbi:phenylalanine--tRNA ligase subunit alpha [Spiroplasma endosymbiont of Crioceris asparagi]|uniref:phenylalanine--tRNA ligase subunit alpha n=1 Tax=Spiroplasma endosymbiont of Crioceris asparagi TaxID=3066286 RepID=UPI0030D28B9A
MKTKIKELDEHLNNELKNSTNETSLDKLKTSFLTSKDSKLNKLLEEMKSYPKEQKKEIGQMINRFKFGVLEKLEKHRQELADKKYKHRLESEKIDISIQGLKQNRGQKHPLNLVINEIEDIFIELGYDLVNGNEFETDEFCFQKLNLPIGHPARDMQDTFYIDKNTVLRTHCTNMTARTLSKLAEDKTEFNNVAMISYGNVYRRDDDDATHSHQFMQMDGFLIGENISFANLKWTLEYMCKRLFNEKTTIRMRPSFFPFTEPSAEVDISCVACAGKGCNICKHSGFIEVLGAGMINKEVFALNGIDANKYQCLAFGIGIERIAMLKYGIKNIRDFYENDVRFLEQFKFFGN